MDKNRAYQIVGNNAVPATQAINDSEEEATFLSFGELTTKKIKLIDEACATCNFWKGRFADTKDCQDAQGSDARGRGFSKLICPEQFIEEKKNDKIQREQEYLILLDKDGKAISKPEMLETDKAIEALLDYRQYKGNAQAKFLGTKKQILQGNFGITEKDFIISRDK